MPRDKRPAEIRFFDYFELNPTTGCWLWTGKLNKKGYANFCYGLQAHRYSYQMFIGPLLKRHDIHHTCKTRHCVNPNHLEQLTHKKHCRTDLTKTHCPRGHLYTRTYNEPSGRSYHVCDICNRTKANRWYLNNTARANQTALRYYELHKEQLKLAMRSRYHKQKGGITSGACITP